MGQKNLRAVNRAIAAAGLDERGLDGPIIELVRDLARRMDLAPSDGPPLNLLRAYLSATKDLQRDAARVRPAAKPAPAPEVEVLATPPELLIVKESDLARIRREKQERRAG